MRFCKIQFVASSMCISTSPSPDFRPFIFCKVRQSELNRQRRPYQCQWAVELLVSDGLVHVYHREATNRRSKTHSINAFSALYQTIRSTLAEGPCFATQWKFKNTFPDRVERYILLFSVTQSPGCSLPAQTYWIMFWWGKLTSLGCHETRYRSKSESVKQTQRFSEEKIIKKNEQTKNEVKTNEKQ